MNTSDQNENNSQVDKTPASQSSDSVTPPSSPSSSQAEPSAPSKKPSSGSSENQNSVSIPRPPRRPNEPITNSHDDEGSNVTRIVGVLIVLLLFAIAISITIWFSMRERDVQQPAPVEEAPTEIIATPTPVPTPAPTPEPQRASLVPPAGWEERSDLLPMAETVYVSPQQQTTADNVTFNPNINIVTESVPPETTFAEYVEILRQGVSTQLEEYVLLDDAPVTTVEGYQAHIIGGTFLQDGVALRNKQLLMLSPDGQTGYVVTGSALAEGWDEKGLNAIFDSALTSITLP